MMGIDRAQSVVLANIQPLPAVTLALGDALFRTTAEPVRCDMDQPPFDRSMMDGFAVRAADTSLVPVTLRVVGQIPAGVTPTRSLLAGEAMQINTGAPVPNGADAVVPVEHTGDGDSDGTVVVQKSACVGEFITPRGQYVSGGTTVVRPGTLLTPVEIGAAATAGAARIAVYRRPTVAVLVTGDELVEIDQRPAGAQIRNSNGYVLRALVEGAHAEVVDLGVVADDREEIRAKIVAGLRQDVLCISGGISMGAFDFVPEVLEECGAEIRIHKIAIKPGRPTIFATAQSGTAIFALPGNPISALIGFELLVRPALAALQGRPGEIPPMARATLRGSVPATGGRRGYCPVRVRPDEDGRLTAHALSWHGSGDSTGVATANAFITRPPDSVAASDGEEVSVILLDRS